MGKINSKRKRQANNQKNNPNSIIQPAPYVIVVHGPPKVGKSLLIKSLVDHYSNQNLTDDTAPGRITIVAGSAGEEQRRKQFVECPNNVNGMIDAAKYADAVILLIDVSYEFEMETFEFVSLLKVHGMPKVIGVFTHLDCFPTEDANMKEIITARFKKNFRNEIYEQAPIFCLSLSRKDEKMRDLRDIFNTKPLRKNDPIIVSVGWRRYQTSFIYSPEDLSLDCTPEDKPCSAKFGGYFATTGTGVVAVQHLADNKAAFRILATGEVLGFVSPLTLAVPCNIPQYFGIVMTSLEPSDRVWAADTKESEKSKAHVVWGSRERKVAAEGLRDKMSKLQEEMLKLPCQKRKTEEQWRAVIILEHTYSGNKAEFLEAYQKKEEDIRKNRSHGMVSRYYRRETGDTAEGPRIIE
ncbi:hypothetical protein MKX03_025668 [Papaver bracteatum]|nr:hypothetical protein MKX03_025668 [Papaver bracteatum]